MRVKKVSSPRAKVEQPVADSNADGGDERAPKRDEDTVPAPVSVSPDVEDPESANPKKRKAEGTVTNIEPSDTAPTETEIADANGFEEPVKEEKEQRSSKKRKVDTPKGTRESVRSSGRSMAKKQPSQEQILNYLLSDAAAELCRPEDETAELEKSGGHDGAKTYSSSVLSPFEELLCALILSRPISHRLGQRTIRTVLNEPYNFTSPKSIIEAGKERVREAMDDAKTQHKDKTAEQVVMIAEVVKSKFAKDDTDKSLDKVREEGNKDWDHERTLLQENIKGLGKTGLDIFYRRVQWLWEEAFPFCEERSARGLDKLGLSKNPDELSRMLIEHWDKLNTNSLAGNDDVTKKRRAFVVLCERAAFANLEGKTAEILSAAFQLFA